MRFAAIAVVVCGIAPPLIAVAAVGAAEAPGVTVGANVQVSAGNRSVPHFELLACASPLDARQLLVGSMSFPGGAPHPGVQVYGSADGGASWVHEFESRPAGETRADPTCAFGPDGSAYQGMLGRRGVELRRRIAPRDRWDGPIYLPGVDRPYFVVRPAGPDRAEELLYVGQGTTSSLSPENVNRYGTRTFDWTSDVSVFTSRDRGSSVSGPMSRVSFGESYATSIGKPALLRDGTLVTPFTVFDDRAKQDTATLRVIRAGAGAGRLEPAVTIDRWSQASLSGSKIARLAVDPGSPSFSDRLYALRVDQSDRARVLINASDDGGRTWSRSRRVDDDAPGAPNPRPDASNPAIAVNRAGIVAVGWADRRKDPRNLSSFYRVAISRDGGETFSPSVEVSSAPSRFADGETVPLRPSPDVSDGRNGVLRASLGVDSWYFDMGHTVDLIAAADGVFHAFWIDNRTGVHQIWTAPIRAEGTAARPADTTLAGMTDVTQQIAMEIVASAYDAAANVATLSVRFRNRSTAAIRGPLRARVARLDSPRGARAVDALPGESGEGAMWDIPVGVKAELSAGEATPIVALRFQFTQPRPFFDERGRGNLDLVNLELRLYQLGREEAR